ncbi:MAG: 4-hydroxy-3-methylbut-2-enyl diphosphate reductase [Pyramidobacter sp.]|jgi:4-hydroxy-3-methylbut-2-enyl diphosphate reductase
MTKIILAKPTGMCFGVRRAIGAMEEALRTGKKIYAIGSPIHNPQEIGRLKSLGLKVVQRADDLPEGAVAFVRAHGEEPAVFEALKRKKVRIIDGTCPFVRVVQRRAKELSDAGYELLIFGNEKHPEVKGILGYVSGKATVVPTVSSLFSSTILGTSVKIHKLGLVSQTTQEERLFAEVARAAVGMADELRVYNTICHATTERQQSVAELSAQVDGMIVIGGRDSANTEKLFRIAGGACCDVLWIEEAGELDRRWVLEKGTIGIAAGASTPDWLIERSITAINTIAGRQGDVRNE